MATARACPTSTQIDRRRFLRAGASGLAAVVAMTGTTAQGASMWQERRSAGPFQVAATFSLSSLEPMFTELSQHEYELQRTLGTPPARQPVDVYLFASQQEQRDYLTKIYPRVPPRRALYVQQGASSAVYAHQHAELPIDLRHEGTHALLHANLPMVPLWLDEGLAEYFEMPLAERAFGHQHFARLRWDLRLGWIRKIESLERATELREMGSVEYRYSWAWVHFMLHGPVEAHNALVGYLAEIRQGNSPEPLSARLHAAIPRLESQMVQHFKHWRK